jgi:cutinase
MASLIQQAKSQCPDTKIIASGYSQGAEVVHNALSSTSIAGLVSGAVLFGDPDSKKAVGALPDGQVKRFCVPGDIICETGILIVDASHLSYVVYAGQAANAARGFAGV